MNTPQKSVLFFGIYDPNYARTRVLMEGFRRNGYSVEECHVDPKDKKTYQQIWQLFVAGRKLRKKPYTHVLVAFPGQTVVWLARIIFGKRIVFDAFLSVYDSNVFDRKTYKEGSLRARREWLMDWYSCKLAEVVLLDTDEHIEYFVETFGIDREKFRRVFISADDTIFSPTEEEIRSVPVVEFHGTFIPLQGVSYIVEAARILKEKGVSVQFQIVGAGGKLYEDTLAFVEKHGLSDMVEMVGRVQFFEVPEYVKSANICLGIFGDTAKTQRVIPNKVYECVAAGRAVITAETPAMKEAFTNEKNVLFCNTADAGDLAEKIKRLAEDGSLRSAVGRGGAQLFADVFEPKVLLAELLPTLPVRHE